MKVESPTQNDLVEWLRAVTRDLVELHRAHGSGAGDYDLRHAYFYHTRFVKPYDEREAQRRQLETDAAALRDRLERCRAEFARPEAERHNKNMADKWFLGRMAALEVALVEIDAKMEAL